LEKKEPEPIDFKEKFEDTAITNIQELVEKQRRERELEMNTFAAPSEFLTKTSVTTPSPAHLATQQQHQQQPSNITIEPTTHPTEPIVAAIPEYFSQITKQLNDIQDAIFTMKNDLELLKNTQKQDVSAETPDL